MKHKPSDALRKAAILISSLDRRSADALLDQMPAEQAARVRQAILDLDQLDKGEEQQVIAEFLRSQQAGSPQGVELDPALVRKFSTPDAEPKAIAGPLPFGRLQAATGETLAKFLRREHPQIVAQVLAHLEPDRAAEILGQLPIPLQTEVLRRVADLDEASPEALRELEESLERLLAAEQTTRLRRSAGVAAVGAILKAARSSEREALLANLAQTDAELAARLGRPSAKTEAGSPAPTGGSRFSFFWPRIASTGRMQAAPAIETENGEEPDYYDDDPDEEDTWVEEPAGATEALPHVEFDDFVHFGDQALARVLKAADPRVAQLAFTGARRELVARLLAQLPAREARQLERKLALSGPLRLRDVEVARHQLTQIAARLAAKDEIELPGTRRFAAAA